MTYSPYRQSDAGSSFNPTVVLLLIAASLIVQHQREAWPFQPPDRSDTVIPDEEQDALPNPDNRIEDSYLVVVEESKARPAERIMVLNNYEFWFTLHDRGLRGFRVLDPDSPDSKSFIDAAKQRLIEHPFVMHVSRNGRVLNVIPFPDDVSKIEAMLQ